MKLFENDILKKIDEILNKVRTQKAANKAAPEATNSQNANNQNKSIAELITETKIPLLPEIYRCFIETRNQFIDKDRIPLDYNTAEYHPWTRYPDVLTPVKLGFPRYPAGKIEISKERFIVLAEGPTPENFKSFISSLKNNGVFIIVAIGEPFDQEKKEEKFYNYLSTASNVQIFLKNACPEVKISEEFADTQFKFYAYLEDPENPFYIMHIPNWKDHGLPDFNAADLLFLGYFFQYCDKFCCHCSAAIGRSPAFAMMDLAYQYIFSNLENLISMQQVPDIFQRILKNILPVKPGAGEWHQVLAAVPVAEQAVEQVQLFQLKKNSHDVNSMETKQDQEHANQIEVQQDQMTISDEISELNTTEILHQTETSKENSNLIEASKNSDQATILTKKKTPSSESPTDLFRPIKLRKSDEQIAIAHEPDAENLSLSLSRSGCTQ